MRILKLLNNLYKEKETMIFATGENNTLIDIITID
jgi:hypothetical protein